MPNFIAAESLLARRLMKLSGIAPQAVSIRDGTVMNIWGPPPLDKTPAATKKPAVVLVHGFAADGVFTWQFQVASLTKRYSVYVPDLLFFGGSTTDSPDRSPAFQADCLAEGLRKLGVERCTVVGFSYGGMVAFKVAERSPELVEAVVVSGSVLAMKGSVIGAALGGLGFSSSEELLMPTSVDGCKRLLRVGVHMKLWFPNFFYRDFLEVMFNNRKERTELLQGLDPEDTTIPNFTQRIHLLWGENDRIFKLQLAQNMKEKLGEKVTFEGIKRAGHLVHLERPCVYNRCLKRFLASIYQS